MSPAFQTSLSFLGDSLRKRGSLIVAIGFFVVLFFLFFVSRFKGQSNARQIRFFFKIDHFLSPKC